MLKKSVIKFGCKWNKRSFNKTIGTVVKRKFVSMITLTFFTSLKNAPRLAF